MPKRSSKKKTKKLDANQYAHSVVSRFTKKKGIEGVYFGRPLEDPSAKKAKNPAAVYLGTLGGKKGGPARAKKLSSKERKDIAKKAANARWSKKDA